MGFALPRQSYLTYGALKLDYEEDICKSKVLVAIEVDEGFCRVDGLTTLAEVEAKLANGEKLLNMYQLADSFMRQLAFKMEKMDKFGA